MSEEQIEQSNHRSAWVKSFDRHKSFGIIADHETGTEYLVLEGNIPVDHYGRRWLDAEKEETVLYAPLAERSKTGTPRAAVVAFMSRAVYDRTPPPEVEDVELVYWRGTWGHAIRYPGGTIFVHESDIITTGLETLKVGSPLRCKIAPPSSGEKHWRGQEVQILYTPEEWAAIQAEEKNTTLGQAFEKIGLQPQNTEPPAVGIES